MQLITFNWAESRGSWGHQLYSSHLSTFNSFEVDILAEKAFFYLVVFALLGLSGVLGLIGVMGPKRPKMPETPKRPKRPVRP